MEERKKQAAGRAAAATGRPLLAMAAVLDAVPAAVELILTASDMRSVGLVVEAALAEIADQKATVVDEPATE
jgi:hypothetical protein